MSRSAIVAIAAAAVLSIVPFAPARAGDAKAARGFVAGKFGLEIDGAMVGWVWSVEGGGATADVVPEKVGLDQIVKKHIAGVKYEPITITCGTGMSKAFYEWIKATFDRKPLRKNGAIIFADYNYNEQERLEFFNAVITEVSFPALDGASKDAAKMTIKLAPEHTRRVAKAAGAPAGGKKGLDAATQKKWLPSNFRLSIAGLETKRVNKIEAITLRQKVAENRVGEKRDYQKEPATLEVSDLVITFADADSKSWDDWLEDFVIKGNSGDDRERGGTLDYLTPNLQETLFTLTFGHLGIYRLQTEKAEPGSEAIRRVQAFLYCEDIRFEYK